MIDYKEANQEEQNEKWLRELKEIREKDEIYLQKCYLERRKRKAAREMIITDGGQV